MTDQLSAILHHAVLFCFQVVELYLFRLGLSRQTYIEVSCLHVTLTKVLTHVKRTDNINLTSGPLVSRRSGELQFNFECLL